MTKKKSKKKKIIIIIAVIVLFILWVSSCTNKMKKAMDELASKSTSIDEVTRRDLIDSVGATGSIASINSRNITVDLTKAEVKKINVKVGDTVKKGAILASFNVSDSYKDLTDAQSDLNSTIEVNNITLEEARKNLDNLEKKKDSTLKDLKNKIDEAKKKYNEAKQLYNNDPTEVNLELKEKADDAIDAAKDAYYDSKEDFEDKIESSKNEIKKLELSQSTTNQESQIRTIKTQVKNGTIKAPIDGTITSINYEVGDSYTTGTVFMSIDDCSSYVIEAEIGEYDIAKVKLGQHVVIKVDGVGDMEINGTVKEISPIATKDKEGTTNYNKTYTVKISIDDTNDKIKLDMTANISIVIDEHKNILTVPYNAVYTDQDGKYYVIKVDGDDRKNIYVDVNMESSYYTEISGNDIYEGMKVLIEKTDEENPFLTIMQNGGF